MTSNPDVAYEAKTSKLILPTINDRSTQQQGISGRPYILQGDDLLNEIASLLGGKL
jgi:hypothetical protein